MTKSQVLKKVNEMIDELILTDATKSAEYKRLIQAHTSLTK